MKGILEARNEIQRFGFYKRQQETSVCQSLPLRKKERPRTLVGPQDSINGNSRSCSSPSDWGKEEASLWDQSNPSIEGNFQRKWFKLFGEKGLFQILFWSSYFHLKFTQIKIIMFSKGLVVLSGGGSLAWFSSMKLPGLWSFFLFEGKL